MCGRYAASRRPEDLVVEFEAVRAEGQAALPADYNVAPTKDVHVVRHKRERDAEGRPTGGGHRELRVVRWGLVPSWAKDLSVGSRLLNARVESLTEKPAFRSAARSRRCLVPADGWYEWAKRLDSPRKQPYYMTPADGSVLAFAGLWEVWGRGEDRVYTCTVITAPAVGALTEIHDRMPLVLPRDRWADWLDPQRDDVEQLALPTPPEAVEALELRPVGPAVGNVANNGPELLARAESVAEPADQPALF
ncbi:SOS response-associated peptidase [Geodermatophilus sp. YIM 151500]|uniref:SOS response-associated peptidase n=1 Tax=Geodermatophilus sp. YIM 151500 TaxID=2984531 RepID=UPI0021E50555|nr:SOS response-associated peptidase [Geodermatophilus sp. YIM 151500]MCV2488705.1 SOS response-associated peptidase [Geodermatophilus sp. YIM 151500]